jgi:hypothetical protein
MRETTVDAGQKRNTLAPLSVIFLFRSIFLNPFPNKEDKGSTSLKQNSAHGELHHPDISSNRICLLLLSIILHYKEESTAWSDCNNSKIKQDGLEDRL